MVLQLIKSKGKDGKESEGLLYSKPFSDRSLWMEAESMLLHSLGSYLCFFVCLLFDCLFFIAVRIHFPQNLQLQSDNVQIK